MRTVRSAWLGACVLLVALGMRGAAAPPPAATSSVTEPPCGVPQSPRNVNPGTAPFLCTVTSSLVSVSSSQDTLELRARPGVSCGQRLFRCGQHYHAPVENVQGCALETVRLTPSNPPPPGQWIEVHTLYAPDRKLYSGGCDPEKLDCCVGHPVVVLGFSARVITGSTDRRILTPTTGPLAEWSGSDTGPDTTGGACKPVAAFWSFRMIQPGCVAPEITQAQLRRFFPRYGPQEARALQAGPRISKDLVHVQ